MKTLALQVEHKFKNRIVGLHLIDAKEGTAIVGSSKSAKVRLLGDDVAGIHASFEWDGDNWVVNDLGSEGGTWIEKKPILERRMEGATVIHIGSHQLKATPSIVDRELFTATSQQGEGTGQFVYHQVVLFKRGAVHQSFLLPRMSSFAPDISDFQPLPPPKTFEWTITESGPYIIKQRLTRSDSVQDTFRGAVGEDWRGPAPIIVAVLVALLVFGLLFMLPHQPDDKLKTLTPDLQNQYTRLILDGQRVRRKKAIADKLRMNMQQQTEARTGQAPSSNGTPVAANNIKTPTGPKVLINLKNAGLSALIGKVAARASKNAQLVQAAGVSPTSEGSGRALGVGGGSALDKLGGGVSAGAHALRIGGLGTVGRGGGSTGYKGTGTLQQGNIGNAEVGALEEESEIEGGLDKEIIAGVIRSQLGQIRYCYERQLSASPDLYGKIMVKFTIGATGEVVAQAIGNTSLNNAMVEGCVLRRVAQWKFPSPKGGTKVLVSYPFLFKSTR